MSEFGKIKFPRGLQLPTAEAFTSCPPGAVPPPDFPEGLPYLSEYHCQYASTADMSMCCWSTATIGKQGIPTSSVEWMKHLLNRTSADGANDPSTREAGTRLLDAFTSHPIGRSWMNDGSAVNSVPLGASALHARRGSARLFLMMTPLPKRADMVAYAWKEPGEQRDPDTSAG